LNFSEEALPMMLDSIFTFIENGDGNGDHLSLGEAEITIAMH
jgi:hypothetical protein